MRKKFAVLAGVVLFAIACSKSAVIADLFVPFTKPTNFPETVYPVNRNPVTQAGFELGRKLFYDGILSADNTISCGSCHIQTAAFTHHGHDLSHGIHDLLGKRNAPAIQNMAWYKTFMWDGGIFDLDLQPIAPITNPVEMDETIPSVLKKLNADKAYPALFQKAFGSSVITTDLLMKALSQFMVMLVSADSKYDKVMRKEGVVFTAAEQSGYTVFKEKCATCHQEPLFTDQSFRNNGLAISTANDEGRFDITLNPEDRYKFKVPSLRNIMLTAPYMHDGRILNIDGVLDHYARGVQATPNLDPLLQQPGQTGIQLSAQERTNLKVFLSTLTDSSFIKDPRFSEQ
jgi:cytochrome c peroxidase